MTHVFVWTVGDVVRGLLLLALAILGAILGIAQLVDRVRSRRKRRAAKRNP